MSSWRCYVDAPAVVFCSAVVLFQGDAQAQTPFPAAQLPTLLTLPCTTDCRTTPSASYFYYPTTLSLLLVVVDALFVSPIVED